MNKGRVLALDVGDRSIGVAVSDPSNTLSLPLTTLKRGSKAEDAEKLKAIVEERSVDLIVCGLPLDIAGEESLQAKKVKTFAKFLKKSLGIEIEYVDERFTTKMAEDALVAMNVKRGKAKGAEDALAASYILEIYLKKNL